MLTPIYNFRKSAGRARTAPRSGSAGIERRRMIDPKYGANMPIQVAFARMLEESTRRAHRLSIYVGVRRKAADRSGALLSKKAVCGIVYRKNDPALDALIKRTFERLAEDRELTGIYEQWFIRKLPSGKTLSIAMSPQLESISQTMGQSTE